MADAKPTIAVSVSGTTVTLTVTGAASYYRGRIETAAGVSEEETSRTGQGDIVFSTVAAGFHNVLAWPVDVSDDATGPPSRAAAQVHVEASGAVTAAGPLSLPVENLRTLLSVSDDFQAFVGVGDAASALGYIHYPYQTIDENAIERPSAYLEPAESWNSRLEAHGAQGTFIDDGDIALTIKRDVDSAYQAAGSERDAYLAFTNVVGAIVADLEANAVPYLDIRTIRVVEKPRRVARTEKTQGRDYYSATFAVEWGGS